MSNLENVEITIKENKDPDRRSSKPNTFSVVFELIQIHRRVIVWKPEMIEDTRRVIRAPTQPVFIEYIKDRPKTWNYIINGILGVNLHLEDKLRHEVVRKLTSYIDDDSNPLSTAALNVTINLGVVLSKELAVRERLQKVMVKDMDFKDEEDKCCAICLVDMVVEEEDATVACTPCNHVFHDSCIYRWLKKKPHCPLCRFNLLPQPAKPSVA